MACRIAGYKEGGSHSRTDTIDLLYTQLLTLYTQLITSFILQLSTTLPKLRKATMSNQPKTMKPYKVSPDTPPSCGSPQTPLSSPVIPPSDPVTVLHLAELLKDVLKAAKATPSATDTPKATEPQAADSSQPQEPRARASKVEYKTVDEMYVPAKPKV